MRVVRIAVAAAAALALGLLAVAASASPASAPATRGAVKFYLDVRFLQPEGQGTFATSGAFTDSGTFTSYSAGTAPLGKVRIWRRFAGRRGSIVVQDLFSETETGTWEILSGTGAYARLRGRGTSTGMPLGSSIEDVLPPKRAIAVARGSVFTAGR